MNQRVSKLLRKFSQKAGINYKHLKKKYNAFNWQQQTWVLKDIKQGLLRKEENGTIKTKP